MEDVGRWGTVNADSGIGRLAAGPAAAAPTAGSSLKEQEMATTKRNKDLGRGLEALLGPKVSGKAGYRPDHR